MVGHTGPDHNRGKETNNMGLTGDPKLDTPPNGDEPQKDATVREFIGSGKALMEKFISMEEANESVGNAHIDFIEGKGWNIKVEQGTVIGWLWLKIQNMQEQLANQQGLLWAAGQQVNQMRLVLQQQERTESGLIVAPPGAQVPKGPPR